MDINNINSMLLDILKEIGNIGSGNAATALASMIDKKIDMEVPQVKILEFKDVTDILGGAEIPVAGIYFELSGDIDGNIMFILNLESACNLVNMLFNRENTKTELEDMDLSALSEVGNILAASYVNSLSNLTSLTLKISIPSISIDMAGAILSVPAIEFGQIADNVLFIETQFEEGNNKVIGDLFLIPKMDSFNKILQKLGVM